jgi:hypothetical protein
MVTRLAYEHFGIEQKGASEPEITLFDDIKE